MTNKILCWVFGHDERLIAKPISEGSYKHYYAERQVTHDCKRCGEYLHLDGILLGLKQGGKNEQSRDG